MSVHVNLQPNRASDVGRGALALVTAVVLVVGVPLVLLRWAPAPLPSEVPSLSEIAAAVRDTYIPDDLLLGALALLCWLVWAELVVSLVVEAVAYARGRKAGAVPLAGGVQRAAARLVAAVALLGAVAATRSTPPPVTIAARPLATVSEVPLAVATDAPAAEADGTEAGGHATVATEPAPLYEVQRRDTLWDIAERHLGDPFRWQEIFRLNQGKPQPDGRCLIDPDVIHAGWQLTLPADATGLTPTPPPSPSPPDMVGGVSADKRTAAPAGEARARVQPGGMVLVDDGAGHKATGGVVLAATAVPPAAGPTGPTDGMVLLPERATADDRGEQGTTQRPTDTE